MTYIDCTNYKLKYTNFIFLYLVTLADRFFKFSYIVREVQKGHKKDTSPTYVRKSMSVLHCITLYVVEVQVLI